MICGRDLPKGVAGVVLVRMRVFVGAFFVGGNLCLTGPCSSPLALGCAFWVI